MSSARSTVPGDGNGYRQVNRAVPSSNEPLSVPKLPKKPSDGIVAGGRLEGTQDHESTPQPSGSTDWTHRTVQERNKSRNEPSSSYSSYPPNTRGGTNPNPVVQAPYTAGTGVPRSDALSQNQTAPNSASVVSRAPPLPPLASRPNRRDELNAPSTLPLSSSVGTRDQLGSESIVTTTPTPFGKPSATQLPQTRTYQNSSVSVSTAQQPGTTEEHATQKRPPGNPQSGGGPPYARGHNLNAPANPASQLGRSDEKESNVPFSSPFSGPPRNGDQDYVGSGSTVAPVGESSATQPRKTWLSSYHGASATLQQPVRTDTVKERTAQELPSGNPTDARSLYGQTRGVNSIGQSSSSNETPPTSSYPTPPAASLYPNLAAITGGNSGSKQAKSKGNDFQAATAAHQSNDTRGQGVGRGNSANTSTVVDVPSGKAERSAGTQKGKGRSSEQDDRPRTLESFMEDHPSLNVTSGLEVHPPFATRGLVDVHSGLCRKRKVFVKVLRRYEGWRVDPHAGASGKPHITTEMPKWAALKHQNICEFIGYSTRLGPYPALVYAWCGGDTIFEYLRGRHLRVERRIRLAQDVAEGLRYLHDNDVVHGDLTLKNVLVDDSGVAQLGDFGLAQLAEWQQPIEPTVASNYSGRDRYRAPELSSPASVATFESDVYSLGCILLKFIEELNPFDGVPDVAKQKRKTPPVPPARRKDKTDVLLGMASFFWNQLEACWEDPAMRPKTYKIVENLQTLASKFPLTQLEQVESPPAYLAPVSEPVDKAALNYGPLGSIPAEAPVDVAFSLVSTRDLLTGRATPTRRPPPRTEGSPGLSSFSDASNASVYTGESRGAGYQPSSASLHNQVSRAAYEVAAGGSTTRDEPSGSRAPTVAPRSSFATERPPLESSYPPKPSPGPPPKPSSGPPPKPSSGPPPKPSPGPGTRDTVPAESQLAVPARRPSSATMGWGGGGGANGGGVGDGNNTATTQGGWDKAKNLEGGGVGGGTTSTAQDDANSGPCSCCVLC